MDSAVETGIFYVTGAEMAEIKSRLSADEDVWIGEIDGRNIHCWADYGRAVSRALYFPTICKEGGKDVCLDWIRDLCWLGGDPRAVAC